MMTQFLQFIHKYKAYIIPIGLIFNYIGCYYLKDNQRDFYNHAYNCAEIINVNKKSSYKGEPSIIIKHKKENKEIFLAYGFDYKYEDLKIGSTLCKTAKSFNFIITDKANKKIDTILYSGSEFMHRIIGFEVNKPFDGRLIECNCKEN